MKLSVIIPCYKDDPSRAISSVKNQVYYDPRDVEIILSMDEPGRTLEYRDVVTLQTDENTGPGMARQRGLDMAQGEYVTFIDADDIWYNALGYALFLRDVYWQSGNVADIVKFVILEQLSNGNFNFITEDSTWCFGKLYRREFLQSNGICFHPDLRVHEDSYFVRMAEMCRPGILHHSDAVYLWSSNPKSMVRRNGGEYWQTAFAEYIKVLLMLRDERIRRGLGYDGTYDLAYCYAVISRMDEPYAAECIKLMQGTGLCDFALRKGQLLEWLHVIETQKSVPRRDRRFTLRDFIESIDSEHHSDDLIIRR